MRSRKSEQHLVTIPSHGPRVTEFDNLIFIIIIVVVVVCVSHGGVSELFRNEII